MSDKVEPDTRGRVSGGSDRKRRFGRNRKRKKIFQRKQSESPPPAKKCKSTSAKKIQSTIEVDTSETKFRIIDVNILYVALQSIICCSECHGKIDICEKTFRGLGFQIVITCKECGKEDLINSCKKIGAQKKAYEVNRRLVLSMRALGHGQAGSETFCGIMDLPKPVVHSVHDEINKQLAKACNAVANQSMNIAIEEELAALSEERKGISVSGDGTWRKRGFSSLQGVTSLIGIESDKVIARSIKNSYCQRCKEWENEKGTAEYEEWYEQHQDKCPANHSSCAGRMEVDGILESFEDLYKKNVKIEYYIGDGDSKAYFAIQEKQLYGNELTTSKKECVGHVQKRIGTRLRNIKKSYGKKKLSDGKTIGGRGRLTAKLIDKLTVYYGNSIRANSSTTVEEMRNAIWATFYHIGSSDENPQHHLCPEGEASWCEYQKAKAQGTEDSYKHKRTLPSAVMDAIRSTYEDLTTDDLLDKCLGGYTQNNNESFNNCIWKLVPKTSFSGLTVLEIGADIAVTMFNDGRIGFLKIMEEFDVQPGKAALEWVKSSVDQRLLFAERRASSSTKEARQAMRRLRLQVEEDSYAAGAH